MAKPPSGCPPLRAKCTTIIGHEAGLYFSIWGSSMPAGSFLLARSIFSLTSRPVTSILADQSKSITMVETPFSETE